MTSNQIRKEFVDFFVKKNHKLIKGSSLIPIDPSVLFTSAGMQQFKPYFLGEKSLYGNRTISVQNCLRTSDIDNVGDSTHLTFFEMLGNFSFGDYFKKEAIEFAFEFLTQNLKLPKDKIWITYFKGDKDIPEDKESLALWQELGISKDRIIGFGRQDNFWGPTGNQGPCGPTAEIHFDLTSKPCKLKGKCLPNCECHRYVEIWNLVFNQYFQNEKKELSLLKQNGVDTGMGLERLAMAVQGTTTLFETDLFWSIIQTIEEVCSKDYADEQASFRIIADHLKAAAFLIEAGIVPAKIDRGYILRRILRRAIRHAKRIELQDNGFEIILDEIFNMYQKLISSKDRIISVINEEKDDFEKARLAGLKEFKKKNIKGLDSPTGAYFYETHGLSIEDQKGLAKEIDIPVTITEEGLNEELRKHQEISRAGAQKKFGGIGINDIEDENDRYKATKLHTATHLLHQVLRQVLGNGVQQMGSDITPERLRFDFSFDRKVDAEELKQVAEIVNDIINKNLVVEKREMKYNDAIAQGALAFFKERYPEIVNVYFVRDFSKEVCAGPHVQNTSELGHFIILKEEAVGAGIRRIKAILK